MQCGLLCEVVGTWHAFFLLMQFYPFTFRIETRARSYFGASAKELYEHSRPFFIFVLFPFSMSNRD